MAPTYISDARLREDDRFLYLTLDGSGAFVTDLVASLEATLNMTLEGEGQQVRTAVARGTLTVDKATQLPVSMGLELVRVCTVGAEEFELRYKLQQSLSFGAPVEE